MEERPYQKALLFMGILTSRGLPSSLIQRLERDFSPLDSIDGPFPFYYTKYYDEEMGRPIERYFLSFSSLMMPDMLPSIKRTTNLTEKEYEEEGKRKINLDPGLVTEGSVILATTKNRAHRIAIGGNLYAELTLIYHKGWRSFDWTYSDFKDRVTQDLLTSYRKRLFSKK